MKRQRGFTLIEILIVIVILGILAAMILPRFLSQTENAYVAEAQQVLGVLRRAEANYCDMTSCGSSYFGVGADATVADMPTLGLKAIPATNFTYECGSDGTCKATRKSGSAANGTISLAIGGGFTCDDSKYVAVDSADPSKGCKPNA